MRIKRYLLAMLLAGGPVSAQDTVPALPGSAATSELRLGLRTVTAPFSLSLPDAPPLRSVFFRSRFTDWVGEWATSTRARTSAQRDSSWTAVRSRLLRSAVLAYAPADSAVLAAADSAARDSAAAPRSILPGAVAQHADLGMSINGRAEMGGAWTRFEPCTPGYFLNCNPSRFPQLKPDVQFGVQVGGTISDRIHVNVDYDERREFDAANNINVYYQGLEDEILQRLEVGDVSIQLPTSRYITQGIPAGNFGFKATGEVGPLRFQSVWAQQKGDVTTSEFSLGGQGTSGLEQDAQVTLDDADYVKGQFFFLIDPMLLRDAPHVDIKRLQPNHADPAVAPGGTVQLYREDGASASQQQAGLYFLADAIASDGVMKRSGQFRRLVPDVDYYIHPSNMWIMLRQGLQVDHSLAVSYVTQAGDTVGTLDAEQPRPARPLLRLLRGPLATHQPGTPTWDHEMHQVYRLDASSGIAPGSIDLKISVGDLARGVTFKFAGTEQVSLIKLLGLDSQSPVDVLDASQVFQPARDQAASTSSSVIGGTYIVFPTLRPFVEPPPVPSAGLSAEETRLALEADTNAVIYQHVDPVMRDAGARYRLTFEYRVRMEGLVSSFPLGAFGLRENSERIYVDGRQLENGKDYNIDYDLGVVTLTDPQAIFGTNPNAQIRATWEQKALFAIAPTSVFGLNAGYKLGNTGELNFIGMFQGEKSISPRPQLGNEPGSMFMGGASSRMSFQTPWLSSVLDAVPGLRMSGQSSINVAGELAVSLPDPNTRGDTYVDDFEATDELNLLLSRHAWRLGSRPQSTQHAEQYLPAAPGVNNAADLVWQHDYRAGGQIGGPLDIREIDLGIQVYGNAPPEQVMYLTLADSSGSQERNWRSITSVLSTTGRDMSRTEYIEFYASSGMVGNPALVIDIGTVSEDAFYFDEAGAVNGSYDDSGRLWGQGILDEEALQSAREVWGDPADARGLWDQSCVGARGQIYPLSDPRANCQRSNGLVDTEDLDGNGTLDVDDGAYFRYVVPLGPTSPYLVRNRNTGTPFQLYRIPLRGDGAAAINSASDATWRYIKHLRMTVTGDAEAATAPNFVLARLRMVGSRWTKRDVSGIARGIGADTTGMAADSNSFRVGPVSKVTDGASYASPPGVLNQASDATTGIGARSEEVNEKSLRLAYDHLAPEHRAEVYYRYPQQPRSFMTYRDMRFWAVARSGDYGAGGSQSLVVRVGTDARNFYMYRTRLRPATNGPVLEQDWGTQEIIDFNEWFELKALAEERLIIEGPPPAGEVIEMWNADSTYAIVLEDRARAPNLSAVREIAFAVYNGSGGTADGEVWINDMRLGAPVTDPGIAGNIAVDFRGGDFLAASVSFAQQGAVFRQLNQDASYQTSGDLNLRSVAQLGLLAPSGWGIEMPLEVTHARSGLDPTFLQASDVRADRLNGLRTTGSQASRVGFALRKRTPSANPWIGALIDGAALQVGYSTASNNSATATAESNALTSNLTYSRQIAPRELDVTPGFFESALRLIFPAKLENSEAFLRFATANMRWTPETVNFGALYVNQNSRAFRYDEILKLPGDDAIAPIESPRRGLDTTARLSLQPFESLSADFSLNSRRDLLPAAQATRQERERQAIEGARSGFAGADLGWETSRNMSSQIAFRPDAINWLRPNVTYSSSFRTDRNSSYLELIPQASGDSLAVMQRGFQADRQFVRSFQLEPSGMLVAAIGAPSDEDPLWQRLLHSGFRTMDALDLTWDDAMGSSYEREILNPGWGYQFGLADLGGFRYMGTDTATVTTQRGSFRFRTGLRLPLSIRLNTQYMTATSDFFDQTGGIRSQTERNWPNVGFRLESLPIPALVRSVILRASASTGIDDTRYSSFTESEFALQERGSFKRNVPMQLSLTVAGGINAVYNGALSSGNQDEPTGDSKMSQNSHSITLGGNFKPPGLLKSKLTEPIQANLRFSYMSQQQCRFPATGSANEGLGCIRFVDNLNRGFNLTFDTMMSEFNVGFQMSYNNSKRFIGTRDGSTQFQLGLFGQFQFNAGTLPGMQRMPGR